MAFKMKGFSAFTKDVNPEAKKVISKRGDDVKYTRGGRHGRGGSIERARQTTYTKNKSGDYTKKVATAPKGATSDADLTTRRVKTISSKKAEKQIKRKTKIAERSNTRADLKKVNRIVKAAKAKGLKGKELRVRKKAARNMVKNR
jgi:hypothetical protein